MKINYDNKTRSWLNKHIGAQTTVVMCEDCGLFYKPSLRHECKIKDEVNLKEMEGE